MVETVSQQTDMTALAGRMGIDVCLVYQQRRLAEHQKENR